MLIKENVNWENLKGVRNKNLCKIYFQTYIRWSSLR